ncbi:MAG: transglutaminase-like domain-containing protein, partial [Thermomicrobia bacterium]|nr:transglutaminase-like domain-containing protein [Thermomicrobia bacterium]
MARAFTDWQSKLRKPRWETVLRPLRLPEGWGTCALVVAMVLVVQSAILRAEWAPELRILPSVTWVGLFAGFVLARIKPLKNYSAHLIGFAIGLATIWLRTLSIIDDSFGGTRGKSVELAHRLGIYLRAAWHGNAEDDLFLFILVCAALMYFFAYFSMWWIFRSHWLSPTIGVAGLILLINLGYDREDSGVYLFLFLLVVIPLAIRFYAFQQQAEWRTAHIKFPDSLGWRFMSVATGLSFALLFIAYLLPFSVHGGPVHTAWERVSAPWVSVEETAKSASCSTQLFRPRGNILPITGAQLEQINTPTLVSLGWQSFNLAGTTIPPVGSAPAPIADLIAKVSSLQGLTIPTDTPPTLRPGTQAQVTLQRDGTLVIYVPATTPTTFTPEQLAQIVARTQQQVVTQGAPPPRILRVTIVQAPVLQPTPSPVPASANAGATTGPPTATPGVTITPQATFVPLDRRFDAITQEQDRLAATLIQTQVVIENGKVTAILYRGQAPNFADIDALVSTAPVPVGKDVTESVRVSEATEEMLRSAPAQLPKWTDRYTQLPTGITQRTADLAQSLAKGTTNQYDYAAAVEKYLRDNYLYQEKINLPPSDRDVADYFLFQSKQGYGEYFSTAMLVLLRLNGVPAREVVGYLPGGRATDGRLVSLENQAHAWVEVYFPQYGWITFDPTPHPGTPPITRGPQIVPPVNATNPDAQATGDLAGGQDRLDARGEDRLRQLDEELNGGFDAGGAYVPLKQQRTISPLFFVIPLLFGLFALVVAFLWLRTFRGMRGA